jgi:hypothetical protein
MGSSQKSEARELSSLTAFGGGIEGLGVFFEVDVVAGVDG